MKFYLKLIGGIVLCLVVGSAFALYSNDQVLNITSDEVGLYGPLQLNFQYSKELGGYLQGQYTQLFNAVDAASFELDYGGNVRRFGLTWGYVITQRQWLKLTAEYLAQNLNFDFASGAIDRWISQGALGFNYLYQLPKGWLRGFSLGGYYSQAQSKNYQPKYYFDNNYQLYEDFRHIAGGSDKNINVGVNLLPTRRTWLQLQLNYDQIKYNTKYISSSGDSGLGFSVNLQQLISNRLKLNILASDLAQYADYKAGFMCLLPTPIGTRLQLGLVAERIIGKHGLKNDTRFGLNLNSNWDTGTINRAKLNLDDTNSYGSFTEWTATPAVHMEQVLAIKDELNKLIVDTDPFANPSAVLNDINIPFGKYFSKSFSALDLFIDPLQQQNSLLLMAKGQELLGLQAKFSPDPLNHDNGTLTIYGTPTDTGANDKSSIVTIYARNAKTASGKWSNSVQRFRINVGYEAPEIHIPTLVFNYGSNVNQDITKYIAFGAGSLSTVLANALQSYGLYIQLGNNGHRVVISGAPHLFGLTKTEIPISVTNSAGKSATGSFGLEIASIEPQIDIPVQQFGYGQKVNVDITSYIEFGSASLSSVNADGLAAYGLQIKLLDAGHKVILQGSADKITSQVLIPITVTNSAGKSATSNIKLTIQGGAPEINIPNQYDNYGKNVFADFTGYIVFGSEKLKSVTADALKNYGLAVSLSADGKRVEVTGVPNRVIDNVDIPITVVNSADKSATGHFRLNVASLAPEINIPAQEFNISENVSKDLTADINFGAESLQSVTADSLKQYGLEAKLSSDGKQVMLFGVATEDADGVDIPLTVTNSAGKSTTSTFSLTVSHQAPHFALPDQDYYFHQQVFSDVTSYIFFGTKTLQAVSAPDLNQYGLQLELLGNGGQVVIVGEATKEVTNANINVAITNSAGVTTRSNFYLTIHNKPPVINIANQNYNWSDTVSIDVTHEVVFGSESLKTISAEALLLYDLQLKLENGGTKIVIVGKADKIAKSINIPVTITNSADFTATGNFNLTINAINPKISIPEQDLTYNQPVDIDITNAIDFGADSLSVVSAAELANHGLTMELSSNHQHVSVVGTARNTGTKSIPVSVINSASKQASGQFTLNVHLQNNTLMCPDPSDFDYSQTPDQPTASVGGHIFKIDSAEKIPSRYQGDVRFVNAHIEGNLLSCEYLPWGAYYVHLTTTVSSASSFSSGSKYCNPGSNPSVRDCVVNLG